ncbi:MAG: winged helix-turn-helix domain-containing protein, partial [Acetobacteraceae bacterium]|nr:winged helix-turn-helix domain-containing protein [Acetobacteraceae bacterium]
VAPDGHCATASDVVRELNDKADQLILLAASEGDKGQIAALAPEAVILRANPLNEGELLSWLSPPVPPSGEGEAATTDPELLSFAGCMLDVDGRALRDAAERSVPLSPAEFALLLAFVRRPGRVLSREQLRGLAAGEELEPYERSIDMLVSRLRRKIEADRKAPRFIVTVPGAGYKFAVPVERVMTRDDPVTPVPSAVPTPVLNGVAERRLVTILSGTVIGLPLFASEHDPEEVQQLIAALHRACSAAIGGFGGTVAGLLGNDLLAYFGYPEAHEDDAERAIRAGFELIEQVAGLASGFSAELRLSAGIATRPTVVGDLFTAGGRDFAAVGEAQWRARRLNSAAAPGAVIVGDNTRRLAGDAFHYQPVPPVQLDGSAGPLEAWRVLGAAPVEGRFAARHGAGITDFVGRGDEAGLLERRWWQARHGTGQAVVLLGEPGIGKSRLAVEFERRIAGQDYVPLRCFGSPYHTNSVLFPIIAQLERAAGFSRGDDSGAKLEKLRAFIARSGADPGEALPLIADLLSIHADDAALPQCSPQRRKERTLTVLLAMMEKLAAQRPVLMIFEDVQWFDATTLELLALAVERVPRLPILLVATTRPEFTLPWAEQAQVTVLQLNRLGPQDAALLVGEVAGDRSLDKEVARQIVERADGIPLFLEELTQTALDEDPKSVGAVPITLQGSLMERLDRLGPAKAIAQTGAVIGRTFSDELLRLVEAASGSDLDGALDRLVNSGLVFRRGAPPDATYQFKHALLRDAAYAQLSSRRRRYLHGRIAQVMEENFQEATEAQPELLAYHYEQAGSTEAAVSYYLKAAQKALRVSAADGALAHLSSGLKLIESLPPSGAPDTTAFRLYATLGSAYSLAKGWASPEASDAFGLAARLVDATDTAEAIPVLFGNWLNLHVRGRINQAAAMASRMREVADRLGDPHSHLVAASIAASGAFYGGHLEEISIHSEALPRAFQSGWDRHLLNIYPADFKAVGDVTLAIWWRILGAVDRAHKLAVEAERRARTLDHHFTLAWVLIWGSTIYLLDLDMDGLAHRLDEGLALAAERRFPYIQGLGTMAQGWLIAHRGDLPAGITTMQRGLEIFEGTGARIVTGFYRMMLAELLLKAARVDGALEMLARVEAQMERWGERWYESELYRVKAEALSANGAVNRGEVVEAYQQAIATAQRQKAIAWDLRARSSLARWLDFCGRTQALVRQT